MGCPNEADVLAFVEGATVAENRAAMDQHLDGCAECMATVAALVHAASAARNVDSELATPQSLADGSPRYILDHEIARGGMGRIVAAHDRLLDRPVALKMLRVRDSALARRFLRERLITARLQHPAIVPIYDAGTLEGGEPFFAMRMVKGKPLDRAVAGATTIEERLRLLPAVIGVVDAVAYAHGEGVIHRDLKPQNVLVGAFGEAVVLDWGIARVRDADEPELRTSDPVLTEGMTVAGEVLGTPAYMAPEQAEGAEVDARADVYGLGAILYELFSGEPPHLERGSGRARTVPAERIALLPDVPLELVAIIQRAMAPEPEARYPTAQDLAQDLKRWQAGRMVRAHEYSFFELFKRWVRKHRTKLLALGAASLVAVVLGSLGVWRVVVERRAAETERDRARAAQVIAESQRNAAESLIDFLLGDLRHRLETVGRVDVLSGVAKAVLAYQDSAPPSDDRDAWLQRSALARLSGDVASATGDFVNAELAATRALAAAEKARSEAPGVDADRARCQALLALGEARRQRGASAEAARAYAACRDIAKGRPDLALDDVMTLMAQARMARMAGEVSRAKELLDEALPKCQAVVRERGATSDAGGTLFTLHNDRWALFEETGDNVALATEARALVALADERLAAQRDNIQRRHEAGNAQYAFGRAEQKAAHFDSAASAYTASLAATRELVAHDPENNDWQRELSAVTNDIAQLAIVRGHLDEAMTMLRESNAISDRLLAREPDNVEWIHDAANGEMSIGDVYMGLARWDDARAAIGRGIALYERLRKLPGVTNTHDLGSAWGHLGGLEMSLHHRDAALAALHKSIELLRASLDHDDTSYARQELASVIWLLWKLDPATDIHAAATVLDPIRHLAAGDSELTELLGEIDKIDKARH